ncbi:uncharacterized protein [Nicotiana tomentosiformis]|uniref:uncharacterized protein n=1 Tax=Nicotiana tomentosiformis TaxID=4098 RepID=UPI00388C3FDD
MEPQVNFDEEVPAQTVLIGPAQVPEGFTATLVLQDTLVRLVGLMESVAQNARIETEASNVVITSFVPVCHRDASVLFDPGSTYSYVSSYFVAYLVVPHDSLSAPMYVFTHILMSSYHTIFDCRAKTVTLAMPGLPRLESRGTLSHSTSRVISYVKARRMVEKGYLAYLAYVRDSSMEVPSMDSVPVVSEFPEVFPADLSGMPPDKDIDFCIDLASGTQPISILPYRIDLSELKELKEPLQDLLDKGFIRPSVSP